MRSVRLTTGQTWAVIQRTFSPMLQLIHLGSLDEAVFLIGPGDGEVPTIDRTAHEAECGLVAAQGLGPGIDQGESGLGVDRSRWRGP